MASRLGNSTKAYNYPTEIISDEAGQTIRPGVTTYGARGSLTPAYYFDEFGEIVEFGYLKKVNLYKEKKEADVATKLALIDERLADLQFDGKDFMQRLVNANQSETDTKNTINGVSLLVGFVASLIGTPATGSAVTAGLKALGGAIYTNSGHIDKYKRKLNALEKEANYLLISKNKLTGEYEKMVQQGEIPETLTNQNNTSNTNTYLYILIAVVVVLIIIKKRKKQR